MAHTVKYENLHRIVLTAIIYKDDSVEYAWVSEDEVDKHDLIEGIADEIKEVDPMLRLRAKS